MSFTFSKVCLTGNKKELCIRPLSPLALAIQLYLSIWFCID